MSRFALKSVVVCLYPGPQQIFKDRMYLLLLYRAYAALELAQKFQVTHAVLKANSPSCGSKLIYDGSFTGNKIQGDGVTAALFKQHDIEVMTEDEFLQMIL